MSLTCVSLGYDKQEKKVKVFSKRACLKSLPNIELICVDKICAWLRLGLRHLRETSLTCLPGRI